ncbi:FAD-dependent pyridine nucleotide-disulfide oxidoreductase (plasmid) [Cupriavidus necator N-1]|uniref:FAD-dependent pyridine nucleotide-disulfide oxidoreductase n=2 Tax=Cupriavidus necator TaxID=106590 RepID=F8GX55_CUPNN|nr:FAD-dependent pyridine nucleotide-disulfide oxidoreductase [Cupriavidus necator N-1]
MSSGPRQNNSELRQIGGDLAVATDELIAELARYRRALYRYRMQPRRGLLPRGGSLRPAFLTRPPKPSPSIDKTEPITMNDVIIIGGSFAGLAAALQLGRARRKVTVLDTGLPRNRFAGHSHGVLGHDHSPPLGILAEARQQLARYPTIKLVSARAESVSGAIDDFSVLTGDGESLRARRLILSYGVVDQMPAVPGYVESWGTYIVPCPYCDGFEVAGQHWGLVWSGPQSINQVRLFHDWTDRLTVFADGHDIAPDTRADLARRNAPVVDGRITEIVRHGGRNATVKLDSAPDVAVDILFAHPRTKPSASLHESLGLATDNTPTGIALKVDERRETSMPGIYAAGDLANPGLPSVTTASWQGATAGISAQQSMLA